RDPPVPLEGVAAVAERGPDAPFALLHGRVRKADHGELRKARGGVGLDPHEVSVHPEDGRGQRRGEQGTPPSTSAEDGGRPTSGLQWERNGANGSLRQGAVGAGPFPEARVARRAARATP